MYTPHGDSTEVRTFGLKDCQISDARLVKAAPVVDDKNVARFCPLEGFKEDIDAAVLIAFSTLAVVSGVLFRRGRWKHKKV